MIFSAGFSKLKMAPVANRVIVSIPETVIKAHATIEYLLETALKSAVAKP